MIRFQPVYHSTVWGGRRFASMFGRHGMPEGPVGESWELVALNHDHVMAITPPYTGERLETLWHRGVLGGSARGPFPLLLKWIDSLAPLSLQVHPDAAACVRLGHGTPKTEAWYVAHADPNAEMWVGHREGFDAAALHHAAQDDTLPTWMHRISPQPGDMLVVPAGMLHAVGPGYVLLEVQQPSRTTFRVYDWQRPPTIGTDVHAHDQRALDLDNACHAIHFDRHGPPHVQRAHIAGPGFSLHSQPQGTAVGPTTGLRMFVADAGPVVLRSARGEEHLTRGDVVVGEPADGTVHWAEGSGVLVAHSG